MLDHTGSCGCDSVRQSLIPLGVAVTLALKQV